MSPNCHLVHLGSTDLVPPELPVIRSTTSAKRPHPAYRWGAVHQSGGFDANQLLLIEDVLLYDKMEEKEEMFVLSV